MKREGLQQRWPLTPSKPELLWFWASGAGPALYKAIAWEWKVFTRKRVPNNCGADRWSLSCAWRSCNLLESTQTMKEVGVPISISQEKRPRLDEVKEHAPDHVPIAKNPETAFWGNLRLLWVWMIQTFALVLQKGLCLEAMPDCDYHSYSSSHWNFSTVSHWPVWGPSPGAFLPCYSVNTNILPFGLSFVLPHTSITFYTNTDARPVHMRVLIKQTTNKKVYWLNVYVVKICISPCLGKNTWLYKILTCDCKDPCSNYFWKMEWLLISVSIFSLMNLK